MEVFTVDKIDYGEGLRVLRFSAHGIRNICLKHFAERYRNVHYLAIMTEYPIVGKCLFHALWWDGSGR